MSYGFKEFAIEVLQKTNKPLGKIEIWKEGQKLGFDKKLDTEGKTKLDSSYQIRIYFSTKKFSSEEEDNNIQDTDYLKNFMIDNFIVLTEGE